jgi:hypothetical protein
MDNVKKATQNFIAQIANRDYSQAKIALQNVVAEKIKNKVRTYINQEK